MSEQGEPMKKQSMIGKFFHTYETQQTQKLDIKKYQTGVI